MEKRVSRITNSLMLLIVLLLPCSLWAADTAGSVNIRALGGTAMPSSLVDANGIKMQCVVGCSGSAAFTDNSAFTAGTSAITNVGGVFNDGLAAVTSGNSAAARITAQRGVHSNLRNNAGTEVGTSGAPLRVDPTGTTPQPVSGTVAVSGTVPVSGTVTANQGGSPWGMRLQDGSGATLATVTAGNALKVDGSAVTQPVSGTVSITANSAVNVAQINGVTPLMGAGATGTGVQRVNPVSSSATGAAPPAAASFIAGLGSGATGGFLIGLAVGDSFKAVNVSTATTTLLITGVSGRHVRITSLDLLTAAANNVALISGTGATCGTGTAAMNGGTTAASGWNFAANGGIVKGNGVGTVLQTVATGDSVCIVTSAATQLSGSLGYAIY